MSLLFSGIGGDMTIEILLAFGSGLIGGLVGVLIGVILVGGR